MEPGFLGLVIPVPGLDLGTAPIDGVRLDPRIDPRIKSGDDEDGAVRPAMTMRVRFRSPAADP
jgi:hypothetical protein